LRKHDTKLASIVIRSLVDNINMQNGVPPDLITMKDRNLSLLEKLIDHNLDGLDAKPERKLK